MQPARQRPRDQFRLVVAAFALPVRMQRHRHNHVCAERLAFARHNFREARRKPIAQAGHFFIFQQQDGVVQSVVVQPITSRAIESVVALAAQPAQRFRNFDTRNCRRPAGHH